jgi:hypothetical protein
MRYIIIQIQLINLRACQQPIKANYSQLLKTTEKKNGIKVKK